MAETVNTQTSSASAAEREAIRALEEKLSGISSILEGFKSAADDLNNGMADGNSLFFQNMASVLLSSLARNDADRRSIDEAHAQNESARQSAMSSRGPERGQAGFWEAAFATAPEKQEDIQAKATIKALTSSDVKKQLEDAFSSSTIKQAVREGDARSTGEKALDFMGFGFISKIKNKIKDRDVIKEEKANKKDQDSIAKDMKEKARLEAAIRKNSGKEGSEDEVAELMGKLRGVTGRIKEAESRIDARKKPVDIYADLFEKNGSMKDGVSFPESLLNDVNMYRGIAANAGQSRADMGIAKPLTAELLSLVPGNPVDYTAKLGAAMSNPSKPGANIDKKTAAGKDSAGLAGETLPNVIGEPVDMDEIPGGKHATPIVEQDKGATDKKETADIERKLDTQLRPEFYQEGTKFYKMANGGKLFEGLTGGGIGGMLGKGGLFAAGGAAVAAALGSIAFAGKKFKDLLDTRKETNETLNKMTDQNVENNQKMKKGWNDDMRNSLTELMEAEKNLRNAGFWDGDEKKAVEQARAKFEAEKKKLAEFRQSAQAAGIDINDTDAMNKYKEEYDRKQKAAIAGNAGQSSPPTAGTPGGAVDTEKVETAEEKAAREEETMYRAVKRAQLDEDVQKQIAENAKETGKQIDESLVGRK